MSGITAYGDLSPELLSQLTAIVGEGHVLVSPDTLQDYAHDETEDLHFPPAVVIRPGNTAEVAAIMQLATLHHIPVTPMGARTGLSGGALPVYGGIGLSMERFDRILHIDERNHQVSVQPGVITQVLQEAVAAKGLFYPPDPASRGSCFIGGNVAENSGGPKAVKYGVVKDYVLNLELVLPSGEVIMTGANVLKNATGYNLTQLIVGSEGTLGVVTAIVLRLLPLPAFDKLLFIPFPDARQACAAVSAVFRAGIIPSAMEFMERAAVELVCRYHPELSMPIPDEAAAFLLVEVDGNHEDLLVQDCASISTVVEDFGAGEIAFAESDTEKTKLWSIRRLAGESVKRHSVYKEEDTVVPRAELPALLEKVKSIGSTYGFENVCYGHAGDGNLHVNILRGDLPTGVWEEKLPVAIRELFTEVVKLGGTISAEHGIGYVQKPYMSVAFSDIQLDLFRRIKKVFDPHNIMNPGKVIDMM